MKEKEGFNTEDTESAGFTERRWRLQSRMIEERVPKWEEYPHTPAVFVRVANTGLAGYGTWKSVRRMGDGTGTRGNVGEGRGERKGFWFEGCGPLFFVSVAAKGLSPAVSLLFATLAGKSISVAAKGVRGALCWREGDGEPNWVQKGSTEEG